MGQHIREGVGEHDQPVGAPVGELLHGALGCDARKPLPFEAGLLRPGAVKMHDQRNAAQPVERGRDMQGEMGRDEIDIAAGDEAADFLARAHRPLQKIGVGAGESLDLPVGRFRNAGGAGDEAANLDAAGGQGGDKVVEDTVEAARSRARPGKAGLKRAQGPRRDLRGRLDGDARQLAQGRGQHGPATCL